MILLIIPLPPFLLQKPMFTFSLQSTQDQAKFVADQIIQQLVQINSCSFNQLITQIDQRKLYVMFEEELKCDPQTDHLSPKSILPLLKDYLLKAQSQVNCLDNQQIFLLVQQSFEKIVKEESMERHNQTEQCQILGGQLNLYKQILQQSNNQFNDYMNQIKQLRSSINGKNIQINEQIHQKRSIGDSYVPDSIENFQLKNEKNDTSYNNENSVLIKKNTQMMQQLEMLKQDIEKMNLLQQSLFIQVDELRGYKLIYEDLLKQYEQVSSENENRGHKIIEMDQEFMNLREQISSLQDQYQDALDKQDTHNKKIRQLEKDNGYLKDGLAKIQKELVQTKILNKGNKADIIEIQQTIRKQLDSIQAGFLKYKQYNIDQTKQNQDEIENLTNKNIRNNELIRKLQLQITEMTNQSANSGQLGEQVKNLEQLKKQQEQQLKDYQFKLQQLQNMLNLKDEEIKDLKQKSLLQQRPASKISQRDSTASIDREEIKQQQQQNTQPIIHFQLSPNKKSIMQISVNDSTNLDELEGLNANIQVQTISTKSSPQLIPTNDKKIIFQIASEHKYQQTEQMKPHNVIVETVIDKTIQQPTKQQLLDKLRFSRFSFQEFVLFIERVDKQTFFDHDDLDRINQMNNQGEKFNVNASQNILNFSTNDVYSQQINLNCNKSNQLQIQEPQLQLTQMTDQDLKEATFKYQQQLNDANNRILQLENENANLAAQLELLKKTSVPFDSVFEDERVKQHIQQIIAVQKQGEMKINSLQQQMQKILEAQQTIDQMQINLDAPMQIKQQLQIRVDRVTNSLDDIQKCIQNDQYDIQEIDIKNTENQYDTQQMDKLKALVLTNKADQDLDQAILLKKAVHGSFLDQNFNNKKGATRKEISQLSQAHEKLYQMQHTLNEKIEQQKQQMRQQEEETYTRYLASIRVLNQDAMEAYRLRQLEYQKTKQSQIDNLKQLERRSMSKSTISINQNHRKSTIKTTEQENHSFGEEMIICLNDNKKGYQNCSINHCNDDNVQDCCNNDNDRLHNKFNNNHNNKQNINKVNTREKFKTNQNQYIKKQNKNEKQLNTLNMNNTSTIQLQDDNKNVNINVIDMQADGIDKLKFKIQNVNDQVLYLNNCADDEKQALTVMNIDNLEKNIQGSKLPSLKIVSQVNNHQQQLQNVDFSEKVYENRAKTSQFGVRQKMVNGYLEDITKKQQQRGRELIRIRFTQDEEIIQTQK